jgi:SET domain-containing protein
MARRPTAKTIESPALAVLDTGTAKGRGVFARRPFAAGEVVETAPVLVLKGDFDELPELLKTYVFDWETLTGVPNAHAVALGYGSMYNHANPATMRYEADARRAVMRYVAARDIAPGEELTINYNGLGGVHESADNNWFERFDIALIED